MLYPATRGVPRVPPSRLAAPLHSDFLRGGDLKKGMGGKGEGRLPLWNPRLLKKCYYEVVFINIALTFYEKSTRIRKCIGFDSDNTWFDRGRGWDIFCHAIKPIFPNRFGK